MQEINNLEAEMLEARAGIEPANKGFADLCLAPVSPLLSTQNSGSSDSAVNLSQRHILKGYRAVVYSGHVGTVDGYERQTPDEQAFFLGKDDAQRWMQARADAGGVHGALFAQYDIRIEECEPGGIR